MNSQNKISVIIPVYNSESYIEKCLTSVLDCKENIEVIIVDDGSTDKSLQIASSFNDPRLTVYSIENCGPYKARIFGVEKSTGNYLMFVDSDDTVEPNIFSSMYEIIENNKDIDLICFNHYNEDNQSKGKAGCFRDFHAGLYIGDELSFAKDHFLPEKVCATFWGICYKKIIFNEFVTLHCLDGVSTYAEDWAFNFPLFRFIKSFYYCDKYLYNHFIREDSLSHNQKRQDLNYDQHILTIAYFIKNKETFRFDNDYFDNLLCGLYYCFFIRTIDWNRYDLAKKVYSIGGGEYHKCAPSILSFQS